MNQNGPSLIIEAPKDTDNDLSGMILTYLRSTLKYYFLLSNLEYVRDDIRIQVLL